MALVLLAVKGFDFASIGLPEGMLIFLAMLAGPSISGLFHLSKLDGRPGMATWRRA